jgi:hypothetical protein
VKAEFAAENNNAGCGDGMSGRATAESPCITDPLCAGERKNGHGRGMCQNGSQRWAIGKNANGRNATQGRQNFEWILKHYYPAYDLVTGSYE